jgi:hypothetical protein
MASDVLWTLIAFLLTVLVLSYVLGDNVLFRLAIMIFIGASTGYAAVMIIYQVLIPRLINPLMTVPGNERALLIIPAVLAILLLFKLSRKLTRLGNPAMGFLTGVGAAVAISGAVSGTIFGQAGGAVAPFDLSDVSNAGAISSQLFGGFVLLVGTISSLAFFHFGARKQTDGSTDTQPQWIQVVGKVGQVFIAITLGALFAGVLSASLSALIERLSFILNIIRPLIS